MDTINTLSYYFNIVGTWISYYLGYVIDEFRDFSLVIKIAAIGVTFCVLLIIWTIMRLTWQWFTQRQMKKVYRRLEERYGEGVNVVLSPEGKANMTRKEVLDELGLSENDVAGRSPLKDNREKLCMSRLIYRAEISENAAVDRTKNLHVMIRLFRIQEYLEYVINKEPMRLKTEALHMLRAFKLPINSWIANQLINSKRARVHRLTMFASIMTGSNLDLQYFESNFFDENCCIYDEIQLGYVLQRRKSARRKIPNLAILALKQSNPSTQCVFIRLMRHFNQKEFCSELDELFQHNSDSALIEEISRTWGYLGYQEGEEIMNEVLLTQSDNTKIAIMHSLARLGTGKSLGSFVDVYRNTGDPKVRYEALRCMWNYGTEGRDKVHELELSATASDRKLFEFFHNDITWEELPLSKSDIYHQEYGENIYSVV